MCSGQRETDHVLTTCPPGRPRGWQGKAGGGPAGRAPSAGVGRLPPGARCGHLCSRPCSLGPGAGGVEGDGPVGITRSSMRELRREGSGTRLSGAQEVSLGLCSGWQSTGPTVPLRPCSGSEPCYRGESPLTAPGTRPCPLLTRSPLSLSPSLPPGSTLALKFKFSKRLLLLQRGTCLSNRAHTRAHATLCHTLVTFVVALPRDT